MQRIRKSLSVDKDKFKEICNAHLITNVDKNKFKEICNTHLVTKKTPYNRNLSSKRIKYFTFFIFYAFGKISKYLFILSSIYITLCLQTMTAQDLRTFKRMLMYD